MMSAFIYGVILAFGLIMPLGVQNIFIFNQGASQRHFLHALPSVLTAWVCDAFLIISAVLGVSALVMSVAWLEFVIFGVGFFFLLYMGYETWKKKSVKLQAGDKPLSAKRQIAFSASVSLLNPHAVIDSIGVIATNALNFSGNARIAYTVACVMISFLWFFGLSVAGHTVHKIDKTGRWLTRLNKVSALIIWSVALYIGWQLLKFL